MFTESGDGRLRSGGSLAGGYRLDALIARGGMGEVWRATASGGRRVAIKMLRQDMEAHASFAARLEREAVATRRLDDDHVVRIIEVGRLEGDGCPFIVMELLEGIDLKDHLAARGPLPVSEALDLVLQVARGLAVAHASDVIHRDLKPSNLILEARGGLPHVMLLDFGIAKARSEAETMTELTATGTALGSAGYMAPEQLRSSRGVDVRADIWALGQILYRCLSCEPSFPAKHAAEYFAMIVTEAPVPIERHRPDLPLPLRQAVMRCLARDPEDRWPTVAAFARAVEPFAPVSAQRHVDRIVELLGEPPPRAPCIIEDDTTTRIPDAGAAPPPRPAPLPAAQVEREPLREVSARRGPLPWLVAGAIAVVAVQVVRALDGSDVGSATPPTAPADEARPAPTLPPSAAYPEASVSTEAAPPSAAPVSPSPAASAAPTADVATDPARARGRAPGRASAPARSPTAGAAPTKPTPPREMPPGVWVDD